MLEEKKLGGAKRAGPGQAGRTPGCAAVPSGSEPGAFVLRYCVKMERECMGKINSYCQKNKLQLEYVTVDRTGPSHDPEFKVMVKINNVEYGMGTAKSKKEARAVAAKNTWEMIEQEQNGLSNMQAPEQMMSPVTSPCGPAVDVRLAVDYVSRLNEYSQKTLQVVDYNTNRAGDAHEPTNNKSWAAQTSELEDHD